MNSQIIAYLNKEYGYNLSTTMYTHIDEWRHWWQGYHRPFHHFKFNNGEKILERDMFTLKMAKKVCEDWAAILLNQKTQIILDDDAASAFLQGKKQTGGILGSNKFWKQGNALMEKAFYSGTGAVVIRFVNLKITNEGKILRTPRTTLKLNYITAEHIIILSKDNDNVSEVAFCSEVILKSVKHLYLELHTLDENGNYVITNKYFKYENEQLTDAPIPSTIAESIHTGSPVPMFAVISPAIVNNIEDNDGLGLSVFADAIDTLKGIDIAYNNLNNDFKLGAKKVFMNSSILKRDDNGRDVAPDDTNQQLFCFIGDEVMNNPDGTKQFIQEHNPTIRVDENTKGIQAQLDYLSFKVGFGTKHYQFNAGSIVTATQYTGDKQDLIQNANKHYTAVEDMLTQLVRGILWAGKTVLGENINPDAQIDIKFDESALIDEAAERAKDKEDVIDNIMLPWEYRMKWYGETEEKAKEILSGVETDDDIMGFEDGDA